MYVISERSSGQVLRVTRDENAVLTYAANTVYRITSI